MLFNVNLPFTFVGGLYDEQTKLTRFGSRNYDGSTGRWTAKDPIGFESGDANFYIYCSNDPIDFTDIVGLSTSTDIRDFTAGLISNLSFGLTDLLFESIGDLGKTNPCSDAFSYGEIAGTAAGVLTGGAMGMKSAAKSIGKEFSHWVPGRFLKNLPQAVQKAGKTVWNGNYVSPQRHFLHDPYRMLKGTTKSQKWNPIVRMLDRIPNVYKGGILGASPSLDANDPCDCN